MKTWRDNLRAALVAKGMTQLELATALGVSEGTISHWMNGRHSPSIQRLKEICRVVDVSLSELVEGDEMFLRDEVELHAVRELRDVDPQHRHQALALIKAVLATLKPRSQTD